MVLVTPGIRPAGAATGDQKRIMTPARAIAAGADYLVVGRPVLEAADPKAAADAIQAEIAQALSLSQSNRKETQMAKGYWIARIDVHNMDGYKEYVAQNGAVFAKYGAKFWCAAASMYPRKARRARATWCWNSRTMRPRWPATIRRNTPAWSRCARRMPRAISSIIEGYDGPQPLDSRRPVGCRNGLLPAIRQGAR